jgi:group I intron endonuclease
MGYVYLITNKISGKKYVGQSIQLDINSRWKCHKKVNKKYVGKILYNAYKKYGIENFDYKIICICFDEDTDKYEEEYIKKYNTVHPNGYNLLQGGKNRKHNPETLKYLSEIMSGEKHPQYGTKLSEEHKKKISERMKGTGNPNFGKRNHRYGKKFTEEEIQKRLDRYKEHPETKEKISNSLKEYYKTCNKQGIKTNGKTVKQYDLDGNFIKEYYSISEAAREVNVFRTVISKACIIPHYTAGGYRWTKE